jgi:S1-C subfamily serine protease
MFRLLRGNSLAGWACFVAVQAWPTQKAFAQAQLDRTETIKRVRPAVVEISGPVVDGTAFGSGFLVTSDGEIATSLHVVAELKSGTIHLWNGDVYDGISVLAFDEHRDLAIVKISGFGLPTVELGNSNDLEPGESMLLFGNPPVNAGVLAGTVTAGIVSAFHEFDGFRVIQTDAAANPGNSGGPLVNLRGQVVGIVGFKFKPVENLSFAVPINYLRALLPRATTGMTLDELRQALARASMGAQYKAGSVPRFWKSASDVGRYTVRMDGDYLYAEQILPDVQRPWSIFMKIDARKNGALYVGKLHYAGACRSKSCPFEDQIEFTLVTPTRIEGAMLSYPADAKFSCEPCQLSMRKQITKFVWIPE